MVLDWKGKQKMGFYGLGKCSVTGGLVQYVVAVKLQASGEHELDLN